MRLTFKYQTVGPSGRNQDYALVSRESLSYFAYSRASMQSGTWAYFNETF